MVFRFEMVKGWNCTPSDFLHRIAKQTGYKLKQTRYFEKYIEADGKRFEYDHWCIRSGSEYDLVYVYLKEV